jgi:hypothetical protein
VLAPLESERVDPIYVSRLGDALATKFHDEGVYPFPEQDVLFERLLWAITFSPHAQQYQKLHVRGSEAFSRNEKDIYHLGRDRRDAQAMRDALARGETHYQGLKILGSKDEPYVMRFDKERVFETFDDVVQLTDGDTDKLKELLGVEIPAPTPQQSAPTPEPAATKTKVSDNAFLAAQKQNAINRQERTESAVVDLTFRLKALLPIECDGDQHTFVQCMADALVDVKEDRDARLLQTLDQVIASLSEYRTKFASRGANVQSIKDHMARIEARCRSCQDWVTAQLSDGARNKRDVEAQAESAGFSIDEVRQAATALGVIVTQLKTKPIVWTLKAEAGA